MTIHIEVENCDSLLCVYDYSGIEELDAHWYSDDGFYPMLDDELVYAEVDGIPVGGETFNNVMAYMSALYDWEY